jgi:hypothetical protein
MDISPEARSHLDHLMDSRRLDLGLTWREVAVRAGISYEVIRGLRTDATGVRALTLRGIDAALEWEPGSAERILDGGLPVLPADGAEDPGAALERSLARLGLSDEQIKAFARLSPEQKRGAAALAEQMRANHTNGDSKRKRA